MKPILLEKFLNGSLVRTEAANLTSRQTEILQLIAEGYVSKQISDLLSISVKTVEKHRQQLMQKLNIHGIALLTRYAVSSGIVESNPVSNWSAAVTPRATGGLKESREWCDGKR